MTGYFNTDTQQSVGIDIEKAKPTFDKAGTRCEDAGDDLKFYCHEANKRWWFDLETGQDVREWPAAQFKAWVGAKLMLIVTEVAEAMEGWRKDQMDDHLPHRKMVEVELADAVIRIGDLAGGLGLDLGGAIAEKMAYNSQRADHKIENRLAAGGKSL